MITSAAKLTTFVYLPLHWFMWKRDLTNWEIDGVTRFSKCENLILKPLLFANWADRLRNMAKLLLLKVISISLNIRLLVGKAENSEENYF